MAGKVRAAFQELARPNKEGLMQWSRLEEFFNQLEVEPKAIKVCEFLVDDHGIIDTAKLFAWLYEGIAALEYEEGLRLHYEVPASRWCVSRKDFCNFVNEVLEKHHEGRILNRVNPHTQEPNPFHDDIDIGPNMHAVNLDIIKPRTSQAGGMSWALMLNPGGLHADFFFVTHSWKEGVYEFSRKVLNHWQNEALSMWCCFLANPQTWQRQDLNQLLGERFDLMDSPFMQALADERLHSFVVVPNVTESLYCRLWCVAELWKAMEVQKMRGQSMIHVAKDTVKPAQKARPSETISAMIHGASCSDENDEKRIRAYIAGNEMHIQDMIKDLATKKSKESKGREKEAAERWGDEDRKTQHMLTSIGPDGVLQPVVLQPRVVQHQSLVGMDHEPEERSGFSAAFAAALEEEVRRESYRSELKTRSLELEARPFYGRPAGPPARSRSPARDSEKEAEEAREGGYALEERIREIREQVERQRQEESDVEKTLMMNVENLEQALESRRRSIVERTTREREREEALSKYLRLLEDAEGTDIQHEIRQRRHSATVTEEKLQQQLAGLAAEPLNEAVELEAERDKIEERLLKQTTLRRQLESLEKTDGSDSVRRHLVAIKEAELAELHKEVEQHRLEDEEKEQPMRQRLEELHEEWQRFRAESEAKRHAFEEHEEQILREIEALRVAEAKAAPKKLKQRLSKRRGAPHSSGDRGSSRAASDCSSQASREESEQEPDEVIPSSHVQEEAEMIPCVPEVHTLGMEIEAESEADESDEDDLLFI